MGCACHQIQAGEVHGPNVSNLLAECCVSHPLPPQCLCSAMISTSARLVKKIVQREFIEGQLEAECRRVGGEGESALTRRMGNACELAPVLLNVCSCRWSALPGQTTGSASLKMNGLALTGLLLPPTADLFVVHRRRTWRLCGASGCVQTDSPHLLQVWKSL